MKTRSFFSILFVSILILSVSVLVSMVKDYAWAQGARISSNGLPLLEVPMQRESSKWLVSFEKLPEQNVQQVIIVDPESQRIGVYHVGLLDGKIHLVSVRHINADLKFRIYDGVEPFPQQIEHNFKNQQFSP